MSREDKTFQFIKIIIGVFGLIFLFYCIQCGVLLTDDSYNYLHAATMFISDGKLLNRDFIPSVSWPPLYSILLSLFIKAEITNFQYLQLLLLLANYSVFIILIKEFEFTSSLSIIIFSTMLLSVQIQMIHVFLWSESLFLLLLNGTLITLLRYIKERRSQFLVAAILLSIFLVLQRNAGFFIIIGSSLFILLHFNGSGKYAKAFLYFLFSSLPFFIWNFYSSYILTEGNNFLIHQYFQSFGQNIQHVLNTISTWYLPGKIPFLIRFSIESFLLILLIKLATTGKSIGRIHDPRIQLLLYIVGVYTVIYISIGPLDKYEIDRYFSPIYPLIMILVFQLLNKLVIKRSNYWKVGVYVVLYVWLIYPIIRTVYNSYSWHERSCNQIEYTLD